MKRGRKRKISFKGTQTHFIAPIPFLFPTTFLQQYSLIISKIFPSRSLNTPSLFPKYFHCKRHQYFQSRIFLTNISLFLPSSISLALSTFIFLSLSLSLFSSSFSPSSIEWIGMESNIEITLYVISYQSIE